MQSTINKDSKTYNITNEKDGNITTFVDLSKAGANVGSQGVLQLVYFHSVYPQNNDTSTTNVTLYECADIKITAESTSPSSVITASKNAGSINAPHVMFTLFI
ncbi:15179_t:CDS:1, partial [Racocetra fulgida]